MHVDKEKCISCGTCVSLCPDCFSIGSDGKAECSCEKCEGMESEEIVEACPVGAISK